MSEILDSPGLYRRLLELTMKYLSNRAAACGFAALAFVITLLIPSLGGSKALVAEESARRQAREIFKELVEIRSTAAQAENTRVAAEAMAKRLITAGFPQKDVQVVGPTPELGNLVARYRGSGTQKPVLLMAHLDVVDALASDWSFDPYVFLEKDGYFYGRGTSDNKAGAAILMATFLRLRKEGFVPDRDLVMVLTADEETTGDSIKWLVNQNRPLIDAEFALNTDGGGGELKDGKPRLFQLQAAEKVYLSFQLEIRNPGGHSSQPRPDNAIYALAAGLVKLSNFQFPVRLTEVSRAYFERAAELNSGQTAQDMKALTAEHPSEEASQRLAESSPYYNSVMRTTCVATRLEAGHADNALPQTARAIVNCRILPGESFDEVENTLKRVVENPEIAFSRVSEPTASPPSPLRPDVVEPIEELVGQMWPGIPVVPEMSTGATDGLYVRNAGIPVYGVSAIFGEAGDVRAHGRDERVGVQEFYNALEFWYRLLKSLA